MLRRFLDFVGPGYLVGLVAMTFALLSLLGIVLVVLINFSRLYQG